MKKVIAFTALVALTGLSHANELSSLNTMQIDLNHRVEQQFNQHVDDAYFEYDRSWIIDEIVVVGRREIVEPHSHGGSTLQAEDNTIWSFSVSLD